MAAQNICHHNKFGFCKFKDSCRILHVKELCDNFSCDIKNCRKRHPKKCKFHKHNKCKFKEECLFSHDKEEPLENKLVKIEKDLLETNEELKKSKLCNEKLILIENKIERFLDLEKEMCEKDTIINNLVKKFKTNYLVLMLLYLKHSEIYRLESLIELPLVFSSTF
jgi:hypothetical protein